MNYLLFLIKDILPWVFGIHAILLIAFTIKQNRNSDKEQEAKKNG